MKGTIFMKWPKIKISLSILLLIILAIINNEVINLTLMLLVILMHELGHIIMIKLKKGNVKKITLNAFGANLETNCQNSQLVNFGRHLCKYSFSNNSI